MKLSIRRRLLSVIAACFCLTFGIQVQAQDLSLSVTAIDWSSTGELVAVALGKPQTEPCYNNPDYYVIRLLNSDGSLHQELRRHACAITSLAFSPDGSQLLSFDLGGIIVLWDVISGEQILETEATYPWQKVAWNADASSVLLVETNTAFLRYFPYESGYLSLAIGPKTGIADRLTGGSWSSDETRIAVSSNDGSVNIWDVNTTRRSQILYRFPGHISAVKAVAWQPIENSNLSASGDAEGNIKLWDAETGIEAMTITAHSGAVNELVWSPDGQMLISGGDDGFVRIWQIDADSGTELAAFDYEAPVYAVAINPDGTQIAYGGQGIDGQNGEVVIADLDFVVTPDADY